MRLLPFALILAASAANGQSLRDTLFPHNAACYLRYYNADHLTSHPAQQVQQILIGPDYDHFAEPTLLVKVVVNLRDDPEYYRSTASCEDRGNSLLCRLDGEAGAFQLEPGRNDALRLTVAPSGMSFEGSSGFITLDGQDKEERVFLLPSVPADSCP